MKTLTLTIQVPKRFKWVLTQPWGNVEVHTHKPKAHDKGLGDQYWHSKGEYHEFPKTIKECPYWKHTLQKL